MGRISRKACIRRTAESAEHVTQVYRVLKHVPRPSTDERLHLVVGEVVCVGLEPSLLPFPRFGLLLEVAC